MSDLRQMDDRGEDSMNNEGFMTDARTAELFFRVCARYHIQSREDRVLLLRELTRRKKVKYIRDVQPLLAGKKVLKIIPKEPK
jgi:hypothetical protein